MLRDAAIRWVLTNSSSQRFKADFVRQLDEAIELHVNCSFMIGEGLIRVFKPYVLQWFGGELFIFQLTGPQAARLDMPPKGIRFSRSHESVQDGPPTATTVSLERLELDQSVLSDLKRPILAKCRYLVTGAPPAACAFRMDFPQAANAGKRSFYTQAYPNLAPSDAGTISLQFDPLRLLPGMTLNAVIAVFVRCFAINSQSSQNWSPISNAVAAMLELADDFQPLP